MHTSDPMHTSTLDCQMPDDFTVDLPDDVKLIIYLNQQKCQEVCE
jgi:hypothetical protein